MAILCTVWLCLCSSQTLKAGDPQRQLLTDNSSSSSGPQSSRSSGIKGQARTVGLADNRTVVAASVTDSNGSKAETQTKTLSSRPLLKEQYRGHPALQR